MITRDLLVVSVAVGVLGGCVEHLDPLTGTQSLHIDLVSPATGGDADHRLADAARTITINIEARDADNHLDPTFDRDVQVYAQFLGTLTPTLGTTPLATIHVAAGVAMNKTVMLPPVFGPTTLWIDDGKAAAPTYATGTSPILWYRDPYIVDLQTPRSETAPDALSSIPLENKQIAVDSSRYGARGRLIVTSVFSQGYTVSDAQCADAAGTPPCTSQAYDHMLVFSFSAPRGEDGQRLEEGQTIDGFAGGISEFNGLTEIGFPQTFSTGHDVNVAREPAPVVADFETVIDPDTWFDPLSSPDGMINFERNEAAPIEIDGAVVCKVAGDPDYVKYKQWKLDPSGTPGTPVDCKANKKVLNVITAGTVSEVDPLTLEGKRLPKVIGVVRPVSIGSFNVWIIYPRSAADLVLQ